jgi:hypothetical protein
MVLFYTFCSWKFRGTIIFSLNVLKCCSCISNEYKWMPSQPCQELLSVRVKGELRGYLGTKLAFENFSCTHGKAMVWSEAGACCVSKLHSHNKLWRITSMNWICRWYAAQISRHLQHIALQYFCRSICVLLSCLIIYYMFYISMYYQFLERLWNTKTAFSTTIKIAEIIISLSFIIHSLIPQFGLRRVSSLFQQRIFHRVQSIASSFSFHYLFFSLNSSSIYLRLLPRHLVTSVPVSAFSSITSFRRQFLRKMCPT